MANASAAHDMDRRERAWLTTNDPTALWPGLDRGALQRAADAIGSAVVTILRGDHASLDQVAARDVPTLGIAALLTGTGPLLGHWIETGALDAGTEVARLLAEHLAQGRARVARIRDEIRPVLTRLAEAGVQPAVMKGYHTAHHYFPEPGTRPFGDVDVVVTPGEIPRAEAALHAAGFTRGGGFDTPYKRDWRLPDLDGLVSFDLWHARGRWKLELHDAVNFDNLVAYGVRLDLRDGFEVGAAFTDPPLLVPRQPLLLAMLSTHASNELYQSRLLRLVELVLVVRQDRRAGRLDWAAFEELLDRSRARRFVYPALSLAERLAPGTIDAGVLARARRATTARARAIETRFTPTAPLLRERAAVTDALLWAATPGETLRALFSLFAPPRGTSLADALEVYHVRIGKLIAGRISLRSPPPDR